MAKKIILLMLCLCPLATAQYNLDYFLSRAVTSSPAILEYADLQSGNQIQQKINRAENSALQVSLTGNYLFAPYFNNHGTLVTTDPSPEAIGYDINLVDGGLYSAQINLERNILNGKRIGILDRQIRIQSDNLQYSLALEKLALRKEVIDQYLASWQCLLMARLANKTAANLRQQLTLTGSLVQQGLARTQDYLLLKIESQNQAIALNDARQQYKTTLYQLYALACIQDTAVVEIDSLDLAISSPRPASRFVQKFVLDSLAASSRQQQFETKYLPELNVFVNAGLNAVALQNIERKFGASAGLSLSWPLFDGKQKNLTRQQTALQQNSIRAYRNFSERSITMQLSQSRSRIETLQSNLRAYTRQMEDYRQLLQLSEKQLQQGNVSMIDHLTLLRSFIEIEKEKIAADINCQLEINAYNYWNW
jgi:outer membrane protein TolC